MILKLRVPRHHIKTVKTALEASHSFVEPFHFEHNVLDGFSVITAVCDDPVLEEQLSHGTDTHSLVLSKLQLEASESCVEVLEFAGQTSSDHESSDLKTSTIASRATPIGHAILSWLRALKADGLLGNLEVAQFKNSANTGRYQIYHPMLLFSAGAFEAGQWQDLFSRLSTAHRDRLFEHIAQAMAVTHIAVNAPIPRAARDNGPATQNIVRSPANFKLLCGDFGPLVKHSPTATDFKDALWVSTTQNGIVQTWAPHYTMFSRGNVTEKTRVLRSPTVARAVALGQETGEGCAAVDLYAGIGYFAFSYTKAGVDKVLCFEINPWSVEGLRRGAEANRWGLEVVKEDGQMDSIARPALARPDVRLMAFEMSNESAAAIVGRFRGVLPPVRHVNCGLLPSSKGSWASAVSVVDPVHGGWIHLHENIAIEVIEDNAAAVLRSIAELVRNSRPLSDRQPVLEHVQRVKTYAPGVMHCILDIFIPPMGV